ncbi:unnamed protein product [Sphagnum tenellum]
MLLSASGLAVGVVRWLDNGYATLGHEIFFIVPSCTCNMPDITTGFKRITYSTMQGWYVLEVRLHHDRFGVYRFLDNNGYKLQ